MNKLLFFTILIFSLFLSSCIKDDDHFNCNILDQLLCNSKLSGYVVDEDKNPVQNAFVRIGNLTTYTDPYGLFSFEDIIMNSRGTFVTIQKDGYFSGSRKFYPVAGLESLIKIELIERSFDQAFNSSSGGKIFAGEMVEINFTSNSIVKEDGNAYDGVVYASTSYLDPTDNANFDKMPGDLSAVNSNNETGILISFGMVNVELQDIFGNPLNIKTGETATIEMQLPASLHANAPEIIPLWYFNETIGIWEEEGTAQLTAGKYVGEVSHFSWWNCDRFFETAIIEFTLVNDKGIPLPNLQTQIELINSSLISSFSYTNQDGFIAGIVPVDEPIIIHVFDKCGEIASSQNIGSISESSSLGEIIFDPSFQIININGELLNCDGNQVKNGILQIETGNSNNFYQLDQNPYNITISSCTAEEEIKISGIDTDNYFESETTTYSVSPTINTGLINACENALDNYFHYKLDEEEGILYDAIGGIKNFGNEEYIVIEGNYSVDSVEINISIAIPGSTVSAYNNVSILEVNTLQYSNFESETILETVIIDFIGSSGEQIKGSYTGTVRLMKDQGNNNSVEEDVEVSGSFSVLRIY